MTRILNTTIYREMKTSSGNKVENKSFYILNYILYGIPLTHCCAIMHSCHLCMLCTCLFMNTFRTYYNVDEDKVKTQ